MGTAPNHPTTIRESGEQLNEVVVQLLEHNQHRASGSRSCAAQRYVKIKGRALLWSPVWTLQLNVWIARRARRILRVCMLARSLGWLCAGGVVSDNGLNVFAHAPVHHQCRIAELRCSPHVLFKQRHQRVHEIVRLRSQQQHAPEDCLSTAISGNPAAACDCVTCTEDREQPLALALGLFGLRREWDPAKQRDLHEFMHKFEQKNIEIRDFFTWLNIMVNSLHAAPGVK
jgi:hypothetical protein